MAGVFYFKKRITMDKEYYYQIKGKKSQEQKEDYDNYSFNSNWVFPPIFSGKISAHCRDEAKRLIEKEYNKKFPLRVSKKDLDSNEFLLRIEDIKENSYHIHRLFVDKECINCGNIFKLIDKYNDINVKNKSDLYCSDYCKDLKYVEEKEKWLLNNSTNFKGKNPPVIYKITNKNDTNKVYIGKTTQVFTLRWYQHFFQSNNCKFYQEIKNSKVSDWLFEIIWEFPFDVIDAEIISKERYFIDYYNSIENGYNSKI